VSFLQHNKKHFDFHQSAATFLRGDSWEPKNIAVLPLAARNDSASFKRFEIAQMQEGTMDSRLRGNDSPHPKGLKALCK
jgi:hypothetical protein